MQDYPGESDGATIGAEHFVSVADLGLIPTEECWTPSQIEPILTLGKGRAAQAILVRAEDAQGNERYCVEKIFAPGLLTRFIYRCAFQAPFAYQSSADAILSCFYRRRVAAALVRGLIPEAAVAEPLYVRWDAKASAYVLGSELIRGRGIRPAAADPRMIRQAFRQRFQQTEKTADQSPEEIEQLLDLMDRLENMLRESGLVGSGWQVSKAAVVATANLLRTDDGYVIVDLESGIPAMLVSHYIRAGIQLKSLPLFDDNDPVTLLPFIESNWQNLQQTLGRGGFHRLSSDTEKLIEHSQRWKQAEIALGRRGASIFSRRFRDAYRNRCLDIWQQTDRIDETTERKLRSSSRLFTRPLYWLGMIPGAAGRWLQKLCGHREFRQRCGVALREPAVRRVMVAKYCWKKTAQWQAAGRVPQERKYNRLSPGFLINAVLAKLAPAGLQRWISDGTHRRNHLIRILLICVSERFQREFGQYSIRIAIRDWDSAGRLHPGELEALRQESGSQELDEYARCFGLHLSLKLITPLLMPLKIGGIAAFVGTGDFLYLLPLIVSPISRTVITLWRMARNTRRGVNYGEALLVGMLPVVGNLAFPVQMYASHRRLSTFLIRDNAARLARWLPIYGGRDSRVEIAAIKLANIPLELLEIGLSLTARIRRLFPQKKNAAPADRDPVSIAASRWDRLVDGQLKLLEESEAAHQPVSERIDDLFQEPTRLKTAS